jgi:hypothetical protein
VLCTLHRVNNVILWIFFRDETWRVQSRYASALPQSPLVDSIVVTDDSGAIYVDEIAALVFNILQFFVTKTRKTTRIHTSLMKSLKFLLPMKHIPILSFFLAIFSRPLLKAICLTCDFIKSPKGNIVRCRASCLTWQRKNVWSLSASLAQYSLTPNVQNHLTNLTRLYIRTSSWVVILQKRPKTSLSVVPCRYRVSPQLIYGVLVEIIKFDVAIAQNVGIRSVPAFVFSY